MKSSEYMHWAKVHPEAKWNLAVSGMPPAHISDLQLNPGDLEISGRSLYGYEPLLAALAEKNGVPQECIVTAQGTSMANHLAMATILEPGDEVVIEQPTYEPLLAVAVYLRTAIKRFSRRFQNAFQIDTTELRRICSARTKLIVLTNLHNPSGVLLSEETLLEVEKIAEEVGALVLVDEVYRETIFPPVRSAFLPGHRFVTTASLTKAYGLSGLRCGWILASADLSKRMWLLNDIYGATGPHPAERLSVAALRQLHRFNERTQTLLKTNRELLFRFFDENKEELEVILPEHGTIAFPRLRKHHNSDRFCRVLHERYETAVVPGRFFEMPANFRIGIAVATDVLREGLGRISAALRAEF